MTEPAMGALEATSAAHFEAMYQSCADPWQFRSAPYERGRYQTLLGVLHRPHYASALEPGCSIGELTALLAPRCDRLSAFDFAAAAVATARDRCAGLANVNLFEADLRSYRPAERFDLIVFSEVGYYLQPGTLYRVASALAEALKPGGEFLAAHWLGVSADHVQHADQVHAILHEALPLTPLHAHQHDGFRIDTWLR